MKGYYQITTAIKDKLYKEIYDNNNENTINNKCPIAYKKNNNYYDINLQWCNFTRSNCR